MKRVLDYELIADNLSDLFALRVADSADKVFTRFDDEVVTYGEMGARVDRVRASLQREGIKQGDHVATFLHNSLTHLAIILACSSDGVVWCAMNVALGRGDLRYTVGDLEPALMFVGQELLAVVEDSEIGDVRMVVVESEQGGATGLDAWLSDDAPAPRPTVRPSDPLAITYSGGTTGLPKGVIKPHFAAVGAGLRLGEAANFREHEVFFTALQFSHGWTPITVLPFCMYYGHEFCFWRWWSVSKFRDYVKRYGATVIDPYIGMVATLLQGGPQDGDRDLPPRLSIGGMGGMDPHAMKLRLQYEEQFGVESFQMYALTESGAMTCIEKQGELRKDGSSGKLRGWYDIKIVDDEGVELPVGEAGEITIRPLWPNIMALGYHKRAPETLRTWRDLWIHTGDLGRFDEDGYLFFLGRMGHFLRRRGELIATSEVEHVVMQFPGISEAAVVAVPSPMGEDDVKVTVVCASEQIDPEALIDHCMDQLAYFKVPRWVEFLDALPRSRSKEEIERFKLSKAGTAGAADMEHVIQRRRA